MSLDRAEYKNKKVLIVGKGNAAFETAWHLMPATAEVRMICKKHTPNPHHSLIYREVAERLLVTARHPIRLAPITVSIAKTPKVTEKIVFLGLC